MGIGKEGRRERGRWGEKKKKREKPVRTQDERNQGSPPSPCLPTICIQSYYLTQ